MCRRTCPRCTDKIYLQLEALPPLPLSGQLNSQREVHQVPFQASCVVLACTRVLSSHWQFAKPELRAPLYTRRLPSVMSACAESDSSQLFTAVDPVPAQQMSSLGV